MKGLFFVLVFSFTTQVFADENDAIFLSFQREFCGQSMINTAMSSELFKICRDAKSYADLKKGIEAVEVRCFDKASGMEDRNNCNRETLYVKSVSRAYFAGAKTCVGKATGNASTKTTTSTSSQGGVRP